MNKLLSLIVVCITLVVMSGQAEAQQVQRIWKEQTTDEQYPDFKKVMLKAAGVYGWDFNETDVKAMDLGRAAFKLAEHHKFLDMVDPKYRTEEAYAKEFLKFAFVSKPGDKIPERITWAFIKKKGQAPYGWRLPVKNESSRNARKLRVVESKLTEMSVAFDAMKANGVKLTGKLKVLSDEVDSLMTNNIRLDENVDFLMEQYGSMSEAIGGMETKLAFYRDDIDVNSSNITNHEQRLVDLQAEYARLNTVVEDLQSDTSDLRLKVESLEAELAKKAVGEEVTRMFAGLDKKYAGVSDITNINSRLDTLSESINERIERLNLWQMIAYGALAAIALYIILGAIRNMWGKRKQQQTHTLKTEETEEPKGVKEVASQSEKIAA